MWPITVKVLQDQDKLQIAIQLFSAASIFFASFYASTYQLMKDRRGRTDKIRYIHGYLAMLEKKLEFFNGIQRSEELPMEQIYQSYATRFLLDRDSEFVVNNLEILSSYLSDAESAARFSVNFQLMIGYLAEGSSVITGPKLFIDGFFSQLSVIIQELHQILEEIKKRYKPYLGPSVNHLKDERKAHKNKNSRSANDKKE